MKGADFKTKIEQLITQAEQKVQQKKPFEAQKTALMKDIKHLELALEKSRRYRLVLFLIFIAAFIIPTFLFGPALFNILMVSSPVFSFQVLF